MKAILTALALTGFTHVSVPVDDQERAKEFYVERLGLALHTDAPMADGGRWLTVAVPGQPLELTLVPRGRHAPDAQHLVLGSTDLDADYARLNERGITFLTPVTEDPSWGRFAIFHDPFGNEIILSQPRSH